jgi:hypothetical protein
MDHINFDRTSRKNSLNMYTPQKNNINNCFKKRSITVVLLLLMAQRVSCLRDMRKVEARTFARLWHNLRKLITGSDGKIKNNQELNYEFDDDLRFNKH